MAENVPVKILIVDEREENLFAMEALLESPDLLIITAKSGNEALGILLDQEVALILLDVEMPGMNGFETAELIRGSSRTRHIPIIFVTAIGKEINHIFQGYESGAVDYLFKPIEPEILKSKVRVFIDLLQQKQTLENNTRKQETTISELNESRKKLSPNEESIRETLKAAEKERIELESIPFNPIEIIERVVRLLSIKIYEKNLELICKIDPDIPGQVMGDPTRFQQIFLNLLSNAYKFTEKGEIRITADIEDTTEQKIILQFGISDTGIGIPKNKLNQLFQSFQQDEASISRRYGGTGLGLSIIRNLLDLMKGNIRVESDHRKGSSFYFSIPFNRFAEIGIPASDNHASIEHFSPVLIIEKTSQGAKAVKAVFDSLPLLYEISVQPVVDLGNLVDSITDQQLIIVDSGVVANTGKLLSDELPKALKNIKNVPVIVMAPSTVNLDRDDLLARGLFSIIRKPLFPRDIKATLTEQFQQIYRTISPDRQDIIETPQARSLNILLVEDNPINTKLAVGFIQLRNWKVDCAINGLEAVERFRNKTYDLVLMDIQMPEMDGMEATRKIREIEALKGLKAVPVVALSAHAMKGDIDKAMSCGMDDYITKPFKPNELYILIEKLTRLKT